MNPDLAGAITYSVRLREILDEEFELLSNNQIDAFENLQLIKGELLAATINNLTPARLRLTQGAKLQRIAKKFQTFFFLVVQG